MRKYLIEGSCDGDLFAETVEAATLADANAFAIERLCEAWGETLGPDTTLDDLGDSATVREYGAEDYARDAAADMLELIDQIARMETTADAMDDLIGRARKLAAAARGEA